MLARRQLLLTGAAASLGPAMGAGSIGARSAAHAVVSKTAMAGFSLREVIELFRIRSAAALSTEVFDKSELLRRGKIADNALKEIFGDTPRLQESFSRALVVEYRRAKKMAVAATKSGCKERQALDPTERVGGKAEEADIQKPKACSDVDSKIKNLSVSASWRIEPIDIVPQKTPYLFKVSYGDLGF